MIELIAALALQTSAMCPENPLPLIPLPEQCRSRQGSEIVNNNDYTTEGHYTGRGQRNPMYAYCNVRPWTRVCDWSDGISDNGCRQFGAPSGLCNATGRYIFTDPNTGSQRVCRGGPGYYWCRYGEPWCGTWGQGCN